jgi:hypothetical protein
MASNASEALGAQEFAGSFVSPKGLTKKMTGATAAGMVGGIAGRLVADKAIARDPAAPAFGNLGYLAVTATEFAIVKGKSGLFKPSVGTEVFVRVPRAEIASAAIEGKMLTGLLTITFTDGVSWQFEVPKVHRGTAEHLVAVLNTH